MISLVNDMPIIVCCFIDAEVEGKKRVEPHPLHL